jgi:periplasmic divalent cation tolerance protein
MASDDPIRLIYTTFATLEDAERCSRALVERRLVACANILPEMVSIYAWKGEIGREDEVVAILKTRRGRLEDAVAALTELHPYETPVLMTLAPEDVNEDYAGWLRTQTDGA